MSYNGYPRRLSLALVALFAAAGCNGGYRNLTPTAPSATASGGAARDALSEDAPVLERLKNQVVIGSAVDPANGAQNPYGLSIAPVTTGAFTAGDLVVCNFNAKSNKQGTGASIIALHSAPGSTPTHISSDKSLVGCDALAMGSDDTIWAAAMVANDNPVFGAGGSLITNIKGKPFNQPWGQIFAQPKSSSPAFYATNAATGTVVRINLGSKFTYDVIAKGFPVNHGVPGTVLAPSGLAYDAKLDTLYFADGKNDTIVALENVSQIPAGGVTAKNGGMKFSGPSAADARIVFSGKPLDGPISTALLPNGSLVVGNTLDPNGKNLMIELSASGKVLGVRNVDKGAAGAIFGIVATGTSASNTKIYFNDDNDNNVQVLEN